MRTWYGFFTSEDSKLTVEAEFKKVRDSICEFSVALAEVQKKTPIEDIDPDTKLFVELKISGMELSSWQAFEDFPRDRLLDIITFLNHKQTEGESTSPAEHGVLLAAGKILEAFGGGE